MTSKRESLMLVQHMANQANATLHYREISLKLSADQQYLTLTHYSESYNPKDLEWVEFCHRVNVAELIRWMIEQGEPLERMQNA